jgi:hypothetical protein
VARSRAASQVSDRDTDYARVVGWYEAELERAAPPTDLAWEPVKIGPTWQYDNGWVLPARTLGWRNLAWAGLNLTDKHGAPWTYTLEQARFLLWFYALDDDGRLSYPTVVLQRLKGWGKDPVAATIAMLDMCSEDAAFDHWNGEVPVGRDQANSWVQVVAVSQEQTKNTMKLFPSLVPPETRARYGVQIGKLNVWAKGDTAQTEAVTSSPLAIEGGRPTLIVRNEPQNWLSSNSGHEMAGAIEGNAAKSEGGAARQLDICNAYRPGEDSVGQKAREAYEQTVGHRCTVHADSDVWVECLDCQPPKAAEFGQLYDSLEAPPEAPLTIAAAPGVVNSIRGDSTWLDLKRITQSIANPANSASESRRKWYNQITATEDAWLDPNEVKRASVVEQLQPEDKVVLFGDGSKSDDATGLVACRVSDGLCQVLKVLQPKAGEVVDRVELDLAVMAAFERYKVAAFWFDPSHAKDDDAEGDNRFWWPLVDQWHTRYGKRLKAWPVNTGTKTHSVAFDMSTPSNQQTFVQGAEQVHTDFEDGRVRFSESSWLVTHLVNCRRAPGKWGISVRKEHRESRHKIDLGVCLIGALTLRRIYQLSQRSGTPGSGRVVGLN